MKNKINLMTILFLISYAVWAAMASAGEVKEPTIVKVRHWRSKSWKNYSTVSLNHLIDFKPIPIKTSIYGGRTDMKEKATGFFYVKRLELGWTLIDPDGFHSYSIGVNSVASNQDNKDNAAAFQKKFKTPATWAEETRKLLKDDLGFNTLACWSDWSTFKAIKKPLPYIRRWNMIATYAKQRGHTHYQYGHTGFKNNVLPVFDKEFPVFCETFAKELKKTRDDPWLIGHFSDNELPFKEKGILKRYIETPTKDASHVEAMAWLAKRNKTPANVTPKDDSDFAEHVIATYYRIVSKAIKSHDPNHLFLGTRFHGTVSKQDVTYRACGPYVDVVSVNYYHRWTPEQDKINRWTRLSGRPIMMTEWYAKGVDSGLKNDAGAGFTVETQSDRGLFYENFTIGLLRNKNVVGWHWFRYIDDGPSKKGGSSNKGILNLDFEPYPELAKSMRDINRNVFALQDYLRVDALTDHQDKPYFVKEDNSKKNKADAGDGK